MTLFQQNQARFKKTCNNILQINKATNVKRKKKF